MEQKILEILKNDAKVSYEELGVMLGISAQQAEEKVHELEKNGIIMGYSAIVNTEKLADDKVRALIEVKITPQRDRGFDAIARNIYNFDEVISCYLMSGSFDLMVIVEGNNIREVASFVAEKLSVQDNVLSCATHFILKQYKQDGTIFDVKNDNGRQVVAP